MILEQALFHLPEILTGSGYPRQSYEGGIVGAFSLALLQSLNGRNIPNPISCLQTEKPFRLDAWVSGNRGTNRYLRCDLHLNLETNDVWSEPLSAYGWRLRNWVETKFFRESTPNPQQNTAALLADLLRLLALVPNLALPKDTRQIITGRYLLHIYEAFDPKDYLSLNRRIGRALEPRAWLAPLIQGGNGNCRKIKLCDYEAPGILDDINTQLGDVEIEFSATTWRIGPTFNLGAKVRQYVCVLTRIDGFTISRGGVGLSVSSDRKVKYFPTHQRFKKEVREHVGGWISLKPDAETRKPDLLEIQADSKNEKE